MDLQAEGPVPWRKEIGDAIETCAKASTPLQLSDDGPCDQHYKAIRIIASSNSRQHRMCMHVWLCNRAVWRDANGIHAPLVVDC